MSFYNYQAPNVALQNLLNRNPEIAQASQAQQAQVQQGSGELEAYLSKMRTTASKSPFSSLVFNFLNKKGITEASLANMMRNQFFKGKTDAEIIQAVESSNAKGTVVAAAKAYTTGGAAAVKDVVANSEFKGMV